MAHVFVDVSNVAGLRQGGREHAPWSNVVLVCEAWLERHPSDQMALVVDWGFYGYLEHNFPAQFPAFAHVKDAKKVRFARSGKTVALIEVPEGQAADEEILRRAGRYGDRQIIAEDHYRPYRDKYAWLQGFELQLPVLDGSKVRFEPLYLRPLDEEDIEEAQEVEEDRHAALEKARAARRNRHQRRRAARSASSSTSRPVARPSAAHRPPTAMNGPAQDVSARGPVPVQAGSPRREHRRDSGTLPVVPLIFLTVAIVGVLVFVVRFF